MQLGVPSIPVLNSDIWKQKIINSSYSDKVIPAIPISYDVELYNPNNASVVWNTSSGIYLQQNSDGNVGGRNAYVLTKDYIDISNYTKIVISGELYVAYSNTSGYNPRIALLDSDGIFKQIYIYTDIFTGTRTFDNLEIDISSIIGEYRIGLMTYVYNGFNSGTYIDCTKYLLTN